jgi:hypothetical protein
MSVLVKLKKKRNASHGSRSVGWGTAHCESYLHSACILNNELQLVLLLSIDWSSDNTYYSLSLTLCLPVVRFATNNYIHNFTTPRNRRTVYTLCLNNPPTFPVARRSRTIGENDDRMFETRPHLLPEATHSRLNSWRSSVLRFFRPLKYSADPIYYCWFHYGRYVLW